MEGLTGSLGPEEAPGGAGYPRQVLSVVHAVPAQRRLAAALVAELTLA